jgi:hypothetical protein
VLWRVLHEADWGAKATSDEKKRSDLAIEFFNSYLADNCGKANHSQYPLVFEQVQAIIEFFTILYAANKEQVQTFNKC